MSNGMNEKEKRREREERDEGQQSSTKNVGVRLG